jgi:hypothetical protein
VGCPAARPSLGGVPYRSPWPRLLMAGKQHACSAALPAWMAYFNSYPRDMGALTLLDAACIVCAMQAVQLLY